MYEYVSFYVYECLLNKHIVLNTLNIGVSAYSVLINQLFNPSKINEEPEAISTL